MRPQEQFYGAHCYWCPWSTEPYNLPTLEHVEREFLTHVRSEHPEYVDTVVEAALEGRCKPRFNFHTTEYADGIYQTTCSRCEDIIVSDDESVNEKWPAIHAPVCPRRDIWP